jgi:hypothetical protein
MRRTGLALLALVTAACGAPGDAPDASPTSSAPPAATAGVPPVPGIQAEVVRLRTDEAIGGQVQVRITDSGDADFTVTAVTVESAGFAPLPLKQVTAHFTPGRIIDLPVPYGAPICDADPLPVVPRLTLQRPDGAVEEVRVPAEAEVMERVHAEECAALGVAEVVGIAVQNLRDDAAGVNGELTLTRRRGSRPVTVDRVSSSVLVDVVAAKLPLELPGEEQVASTPIVFTPASCDPHVLAETKQPFVFPLSVAVGKADPVVVDLPLDQPARDQLLAMVKRVCSGS